MNEVSPFRNRIPRTTRGRESTATAVETNAETGRRELVLMVENSIEERLETFAQMLRVKRAISRAHSEQATG